MSDPRPEITREIAQNASRAIVARLWDASPDGLDTAVEDVTGLVLAAVTDCRTVERTLDDIEADHPIAMMAPPPRHAVNLGDWARP